MSETPSTQTRFHSHQAAQSAAFFGLLGVPYAYRTCTITLLTEAHRPDFWRAEQQAWVDMGETYPRAAELARAKAVVATTAQPLYIQCGAFRPPQSVYDDHIDIYGFTPEGSGEDYWWCECPVCGRWGLPMPGGAANCRAAVSGGYLSQMSRNTPITHRAWQPPTTLSAR